MKKIIKYLKNPKLIIIYLMNKNFFSFLSDELYLKWKYRLIFGKKLNLENPQTFNEKLQWLKLYDRNPKYTQMVDKYEAKEYAKKIIGEKYIIKTLGIYNTYDEINFDILPDKFVIKPTHTSGDVYLCKNKSQINHKELKHKIRKWLKRDYYKIHREWPYKNVKPRIIIEEYIEDKKSKNLKDYKFFVFNGKFVYSFVCSDRANSVKFTFFDKNGKFMDFTQDECPNDPNVSKPKKYDKMIELAEKLAKDIPEVRVDFYERDNDIYFGELTFFDSAGFGKFEPEEWDLKIGNMLVLPQKEKSKDEKVK